MTTMELTATPSRVARAETLRQLAAVEVRRYARHPLFLLGVLVTVVCSFAKPDSKSSVYLDGIVPAAALGVLGIVTMARLTRSSHALSRSAGATPIRERTQTAALAIAALLPFAVGICWFGWALVVAHNHPVPANGFPFGPVSGNWKAALLFGDGAVPALGGPLLGLAIGRWLPQRGSAPVAAVLLVAAVIVMQGLFEPLRRVRVVMPWTTWGGPIGIKGDSNRMLVLSGSPQWWIVYLFALCGIAVVAALWHDHESRTARLRNVGAALLVGAAVLCALAMFTGTPHTLVNPLPSG
jgi:hypothetical protein